FIQVAITDFAVRFHEIVEGKLHFQSTVLAAEVFRLGNFASRRWTIAHWFCGLGSGSCCQRKKECHNSEDGKTERSHADPGFLTSLEGRRDCVWTVTGV